MARRRQGRLPRTPIRYGTRHRETAGGSAFNVHYTTDSVPVEFAHDEDLTAFYEQRTPIPIALRNGSVLRMVDLAPGGQSPMHATNSLGYGVVIEGEVVLILEALDNGPRRTLKVGDVSVQRGTSHAWRNGSSTEWARMLYVLLDAEVPGREENFGGIELPK
ncbi:hypothetical protein BDV12DRAFT_201864 [Aspergillus spectabilis]